MKDIKTGISDLALWKGYCDKKIQCEKLTEENAQLKADMVELLNLISSTTDAMQQDDVNLSSEIKSGLEIIQKHKELEQ